MIHYYHLYEQEGLVPSQDILNANKEYRQDLEVIGTWAGENLQVAPGGKVSVTEVFGRFQSSPECVDDLRFMKQAKFTSDLR